MANLADILAAMRANPAGLLLGFGVVGPRVPTGAMNG
jgi:hypothetical protein